MDFNKLAKDIVCELKEGGVTYRIMSNRCGISRQAFARRLHTNSLTTEDLTILGSMSVVLVGNGTALLKVFKGLL